MVTISLAGPFALCTFSLCTGEKKLLMSFIPDPICFGCCFGSFSPGGLFRPSFSIATWFSGSRSRNEPKICYPLSSMYSLATSCLYLSITSRLDTVPGICILILQGFPYHLVPKGTFCNIHLSV